VRGLFQHAVGLLAADFAANDAALWVGRSGIEADELQRLRVERRQVD
jgi:hypothetical protein